MRRRLGGAILTGVICTGLVVADQKKEIPKREPVAVEKATGAVEKTSVAPVNRRLIVYYLHGTARCFTCKKFESLTKKVMDESFGEEIKKGRMEYRVINVDKKENGHYVQDYQLYSKSVVLSDVLDGKQTRWKNLDHIWEKVRDEDAYKKYIRDQVASYLKN